MNPRRLYRSRHDRRLAGVAGGMAEYLDMDPTVVRVLWILGAFLGGAAILLYIIMTFVVPLEPEEESFDGGPGDGASAVEPGAAGAGVGDPGIGPGAAAIAGGEAFPASAAGWPARPARPAPLAQRRRVDRRPGRGGLSFGVFLIVLGSFALTDTLIPGWAGAGALGPALLLAFGVVLMAGSFRRGATAP